MHILLVNTNPVVSRLISLNTRDDAAIHVDEINGSEMTPEEWYDVVFIDEKCCDDGVIGAHLQKVKAGEKILFSSREGSSIEGIDRVIVKPFLPSEITTVLQSVLQNKETTIEDKPEPLPSGESGEINEDSEIEENSILDGREIEKIKQLLLDEESEVESESMIVEGQNKPEKRDKPKKKKKNKKVSKTKEKRVSFEENLLEALVEMKPKKIRKLLEGAQVSITIRFPKGVQ